MGIISMICGIIGILGLFIIGFGINIDWELYGYHDFYLPTIIILFLLAFIFGIITLKKRHSYKYRRMSISGLVLGITGLTFFIVIFSIVVVSEIRTYGMYSFGKKQTIEDFDPCPIPKPRFSFYTDIGTIRATTKDNPPYSIIVDLVIGYDIGDTETANDLVTKNKELRYLLDEFFRSKLASELIPENEENLKKNIREIINEQLFDANKIRIVSFIRLHIFE